MTKQEFIDWAKGRGYKEDNFKHLQKQLGGDTIRLKLSSIAVRYEKQITMPDNKHEWIRIYSGYFSKLSINNKGQLVGLKR